jgi:hypothetical protein
MGCSNGNIDEREAFFSVSYSTCSYANRTAVAKSDLIQINERISSTQELRSIIFNRVESAQREKIDKDRKICFTSFRKAFDTQALVKQSMQHGITEVKMPRDRRKSSISN